MIVKCEKCQIAFDIDNSLIKEKGSEFRCPKCKHVFKVYPLEKAKKVEQAGKETSEPYSEVRDGLNFPDSRICPSCNTENKHSANFCEECGNSFNKCPNCKEDLHNNPKFCPNCGHKLRFFCPECKHEYFEDQLYCQKCNYELSDISKKTVEITAKEKTFIVETPKVSRIAYPVSSHRIELDQQVSKILPAVRAQFEAQAKQTENALQMLSWISQNNNFKKDFLNNLGNDTSYSKQRKIKKPWDQFLNFSQRREPDYSKALEALCRITDEFPNNLDILFNIAICHRMMGNMNKVFESLVQAKSVNGASPEVLHALLGTSCLLRYWKTFRETLRSYYKIARDNDSQSHLLFEYELRFGFYKDALQTLNDLLTMPDYSPSPSLSEYLTLIAVRCMDDINISIFFQKINDYPSAINDLIHRLEPKARNKETPEYRVGKAGENEALHIIKQKHIDTESKRLYDLRQKSLQENKLEEAKKICEELSQLRHENRTMESYLYEGYLIETNRLIDAGSLNSLKRAEYLCWSIPSKERPEGWQEVNNKLLIKRKHYVNSSLASKSKRIAGTPEKFYTQKRPVDKVMIEANRLAKNDPESVIKLLTLYEDQFINLTDKIRMNNLLGHSYVRVNKHNEAIRCYMFVLNNALQKQQKIGALFSLALIYRREGEYQNAIDSLNKIIMLDKSRKHQVAAMIENIQTEDKQSDDKSLKEKITTNLLDLELLNTSRFFSLGTPIDETSDFLEIEIKEAKVEGLGQKLVETKNFKIADAEYLQLEATNLFKRNKAEMAAVFYLSAVKVLYFLNRKDDNTVAEYLRNFCAAKGTACIMQNSNWDVARTYYSELFCFSTNFVFSQKDIFDPKESLVTQSEITFSQFLSTYHRTKETFLEKQNWAFYNLLDILKTENEKIIYPALKGLILLASYNSEVGRYILFMAKNRYEILDKLCCYLSKVYNKSAKKASYEFLEEMLDSGVSHIRELTHIQISQFQLFEANLSSFAQLREKTPQFIELNPPFQDLGVDYQGTDTRYLEKMKSILRSIEHYDSAANFDDRESKYLTAIQFIHALIDDIAKSPTYWGRTYMQPLVKKWKNLLEEDFRKRDDQESPEILIEAVERTDLDLNTGIAEIHILVSNRGTRSASGIKLNVLSPLEKSYTPVKNIYEIGTIRFQESITTVIDIKPITNEDRLTLYYQVCYDKRGMETAEDPRTISVTLTEELFEDFHNPYTEWSGSSIVTKEKMFKGRTAFVDEIVDTLKKVGRNKAIVIHGQKRSGKSSILYHVARKLENQTDSNFLPIELDIGAIQVNMNVSTFFHTILTRFESKLAEIPPIPSVSELSENPGTIFINYLRKINKLPEMKNYVPLLIIDEFTYLYLMIKKGHVSENFMLTWKSIIEKHLFAVLLAGADDMPDFIKENANAFASNMQKYVGYLDKNGARELIVEPIWDHKKNLSRLQETAFEKMFKLTAGNPFYIQILMDRLAKYMKDKNIGRAILADVDKVVEDYINQLQLGEAPAIFDNLTSCLPKDNEKTRLEMRILQIIAHITTNDDFATNQSILQEFGNNEHEDVQNIILRLLERNVLVSKPYVMAYKIQVELFKLWLNQKKPYERLSSLKNPYIIGDPVTGENFYGRQREIDEILQKISNQSVLLDDEWRTGKTSLLYKIENELNLMNSGEHYFITIFASIDGCPEDIIWHRIAEGFRDAVNNQPALKILSVLNPAEYTLKHLKVYVLALAEEINNQLEKGIKVKFIVAIDEAQQFNIYSPQTRADLRNFLSQDLAIKPHLSSIIAGYDIERLGGSSSPWTNFVTPVHLRELSDNEIESLIIDPIKKLYNYRYRFDRPAIEKISKYSRKIPYDIHVYCHYAFIEMLAKGESVITADIVDRIKSRADSQISHGTNKLRGESNE